MFGIHTEKSIDEMNSMASQAVTCVYYRHQTGERTKPNVQLSFVNGAWVDLRFHLKPSFQKVVRCIDCATAREVSLVN
ncbi:hypothetical protein POTOM_015643 [Populus tomentosa]|uniref:Uncharacterized protein n=1 Tax=Populus tomentosa TaxID=118781 RepID=A0A8X8D659_POPTO|nr:hypothetical protein POTOM_015643 [Populus tomentosa]